MSDAGDDGHGVDYGDSGDYGSRKSRRKAKEEPTSTDMKCRACEFTWTRPAGSKAQKCKRCGSMNTGTAPITLAQALIGLVLGGGFVIFLCSGGLSCFSRGTPSKSETATPNPTAKHEPIVPAQGQPVAAFRWAVTDWPDGEVVGEGVLDSVDEKLWTMTFTPKDGTRSITVQCNDSSIILLDEVRAKSWSQLRRGQGLYIGIMGKTGQVTRCSLYGLGGSTRAAAGWASAGKEVNVKGYIDKNGRSVSTHSRSSPGSGRGGRR